MQGERSKAERLAQEIVRQSEVRGVGPGKRLPIEAQLGERHRVGRPLLRQALRLLEIQGVLEIRPGTGSGTVLRAASPSCFARTVSLQLLSARCTVGELLDAWSVTAPRMAELAAANPDRARARETLRLVVATPREGGTDADWAAHLAVEALCENPVQRLTLGSVGRIVIAHLLPWAATADSAMGDLPAVACAIARNQPEVAREQMARHVAARSAPLEHVRGQTFAPRPGGSAITP